MSDKRNLSDHFQKVFLSFLVLPLLPIPLTFLPVPSTYVIQRDRWNLMSRRGFPPPRRGGGIGRGENYCLVAPVFEQNIATVWNERPTIVWRGQADWVKLFPKDEAPPATGINLSAQTDASLHSLSLDQTLQPGRTYSLIFKPHNIDASPPFSLQVMASPERERVAADLQALAAQGGTVEEIAVRQADYFAERELWTDFWQTVTAVENPSQAFQDELKEIENAICTPAPAPGA